MSLHDVAELPQRIAIVLEHDLDSETDPWSVVSYLVYDTGRRQRATLKALPSREAAADAMKELWAQMRRR